MTEQSQKSLSALQRLAKFKERQYIRRAMLLLPDWITPNRVTISRAVIMCPFIALVLATNYFWALCVFGLTMFLDFVDGALAQARDQHTELGAFLDPLIDKVVICMALLALAGSVPMGWLVFVGVFGIGAGLTFVRIQNKTRTTDATAPAADIRARPIGKFKLLTEVVGVSLMLIGLWLGWGVLLWAGSFTMMLSVYFGILSLKSHLD